MRTVQLTPYDNGLRTEPKPWFQHDAAGHRKTRFEDFGKVDFEDDAGETVCTAYVTRDPDGTFTMRITNWREPGDLEVVIE